MYVPHPGLASLLVLTFGDFPRGACCPLVPLSGSLALLPLRLLTVNGQSSKGHGDSFRTGLAEFCDLWGGALHTNPCDGGSLASGTPPKGGKRDAWSRDCSLLQQWFCFRCTFHQRRNTHLPWVLLSSLMEMKTCKLPSCFKNRNLKCCVILSTRMNEWISIVNWSCGKEER